MKMKENTMEQNQIGSTADLKDTFVLVNILSSGHFYAPLIKEMGYKAIHVIALDDLARHFSQSVYEEVRSRLLEQVNDPLFTEVIVHTGDITDLVKQLSTYRLVGVLPGGEYGVSIADQLSERLGVPSNGSRLSAARRDKYLMQCAVAEAGVRTKQFLVSDNTEEIIEWARKHNLTSSLVIKPRSSSGTLGVIFCEHEDEIQSALQAIHDNPDEKRSFLVEERLLGTEYGVNTVSWNGKHRIVEVWRYHKVRVRGAGMVYDCTCLNRYPEGNVKEVGDYACQVLDALGVEYGPSHTEIILTATGPVLVESGARAMGGNIPRDLIEEAIGQSQIRLTLQAYVDPDQFCAAIDTRYVVHKHLIRKHLISRTEGEPQDEIPAPTLIADLESSVRGDFIELISSWHIPKTIDMLTSPGVIFLLHEDPQVVLADYRKIRTWESSQESEFYGLNKS